MSAKAEMRWRPGVGGVAGWLLKRFESFGGNKKHAPRLALVERIALAPRQSLTLVEAEGRRFLVATSADGGAAFYPLDEPGRAPRPYRPARVSW